jgi:hypothetical protein
MMQGVPGSSSSSSSPQGLQLLQQQQQSSRQAAGNSSSSSRIGSAAAVSSQPAAGATPAAAAAPPQQPGTRSIHTSSSSSRQQLVSTQQQAALQQHAQHTTAASRQHSPLHQRLAQQPYASAVRQCSSSAAAVRHMNGFHMARLIVQQEGLGGLYRGFWPSLATFVPNSALWWGAYGFWQRFLWEQMPQGAVQPAGSSSSSSSRGPSTGVVVGVQTTAAVLSGCTASVLTNPLDLVKTRLQVGGWCCQGLGLCSDVGPINRMVKLSCAGCSFADACFQTPDARGHQTSLLHLTLVSQPTIKPLTAAVAAVVVAVCPARLLSLWVVWCPHGVPCCVSCWQRRVCGG